MRKASDHSEMDDLGDLDFNIDFSGKSEEKKEGSEEVTTHTGWIPSPYEEETKSKQWRQLTEKYLPNYRVFVDFRRSI